MKNYKSYFANQGIKTRVQNIFAISVAITVILCFVFFTFYTSVKLSHTYAEKNEDKISSVQNSYSAMLDNANNISKLVMINDSVLTYLRYNGTGSNTKMIAEDTVRNELFSILNSFSGNYYVFVIRRQETLDREDVSSDPRTEAHVRDDRTDYYSNTAMGIMKPVESVIYSDDWYGFALDKHGSYAVIPDNSDAFTDNTGIGTISFVRIINDIDTQKPIGLLVINIPKKELEDTYSYLGNDTSVAYVNDDGTCISSGMTQEELDRVTEANPLIFRKDNYESIGLTSAVSCSRIPGTDIRIICSSKISFVSGISTEMILLVFGILSVILGMLLFIRNYINRNITTPITRLSESMNPGDGEVPEQIQIISHGGDEISRLQECYNEMTLRISRLLEQVVEQEKQRRRAEMAVIQEQMKPHFLYNTLETIGYMALQNSREEVYDAIETLGVFYRKFLSKGSESITVADEVSIVKNYIKLLRLRYDDLFEDSYEIEEGLESVMIIKLILQPLVENSIYHGIRPKGETGEIKISIYSENNRMHIKVYDTGIGMSEEQINALLNGENKKSFGFKGTISRIKSFYQNDVYVSINSTEGEYCEIDINIPRSL